MFVAHHSRHRRVELVDDLDRFAHDRSQQTGQPHHHRIDLERFHIELLPPAVRQKLLGEFRRPGDSGADLLKSIPVFGGQLGDIENQ